MTTPFNRTEPYLVTALTAALTVFAVSVHAEEPFKGKEKCYGVAKAGENGCQAVSGSHTCGGCSSIDFRGEDWKWVPAGTCLSMGGQLKPFEGLGKQADITPIPKKP